MSLASFNMFVGGAIGTSVNAVVIDSGNLSTIYLNSAVILFLVSMVAAFFISQFEASRQKEMLEKNGECQ
jgi:high-affinity Fe2+/Pb2+ permease